MAKGVKTGGRVRGTPNKKNQELREFFDSVSFHLPSELIAILPELDANKKAEILLRLMEYLYPKKRPTVQISEFDGKMGFADGLDMLNI